MKLRLELMKLPQEQFGKAAGDFGCVLDETLDREQLVDQFLAWMMDEKNFANLLLGLSQEEYDLLRKAARCTSMRFDPGKQGRMIAHLGYLMVIWIGVTGKNFSVCDEFKPLLRRVDTEEYQQLRTKSMWLMKCVRYANEYYGIYSFEVLYRLYALRMEDSFEDMVEMLFKIPSGVLEAFLGRLEAQEAMGIMEGHPLCSKYGMLYDMHVYTQYDVGDYCKAQGDLPFYMPSEEEADAGDERISLSKDSLFADLYFYQVNCMRIDSKTALDHLLAIYDRTHEGMNYVEIAEELFKADSKKELPDELLVKVKAIVEKTRIALLRGHTLEEVRVLAPSMCDEKALLHVPQLVRYADEEEPEQVK